MSNSPEQRQQPDQEREINLQDFEIGEDVKIPKNSFVYVNGFFERAGEISESDVREDVNEALRVLVSKLQKEGKSAEDIQAAAEQKKADMLTPRTIDELGPEIAGWVNIAPKEEKEEYEKLGDQILEALKGETQEQPKVEAKKESGLEGEKLEKAVAAFEDFRQRSGPQRIDFLKRKLRKSDLFIDDVVVPLFDHYQKKIPNSVIKSGNWSEQMLNLLAQMLDLEKGNHDSISRHVRAWNSKQVETPEDALLNQKKQEFLNRLGLILEAWNESEKKESDQEKFLNQVSALQKEAEATQLFGKNLDIPENVQAEELKKSFYNTVAALEGKLSLEEEEQYEHIENAIGYYLPDIEPLLQEHSEATDFKQAVQTFLTEKGDERALGVIEKQDSEFLLKTTRLMLEEKKPESAEPVEDRIQQLKASTEKYIEQAMEWAVEASEVLKKNDVAHAEAVLQAWDHETSALGQLAEKMTQQDFQTLRESFGSEWDDAMVRSHALGEEYDRLVGELEQAKRKAEKAELHPRVKEVLESAKMIAFLDYAHKNSAIGMDVLRREFEVLWQEDEKDVIIRLQKELVDRGLLD